ncbi:MAG: hypothetical protein Q9M97_05655 [Candidatus Gracilibacteria bacterium]|nr:hypothetical protein [Candidatus Gracilibacteria bacterium]
MDKKQTSTLQDKLRENPNFFFEMEIKVSKEMYAKHIDAEKEEKRLIEEWVLKELNKY